MLLDSFEANFEPFFVFLWSKTAPPKKNERSQFPSWRPCGKPESGQIPDCFGFRFPDAHKVASKAASGCCSPLFAKPKMAFTE